MNPHFRTGSKTTLSSGRKKNSCNQQLFAPSRFRVSRAKALSRKGSEGRRIPLCVFAAWRGMKKEGHRSGSEGRLPAILSLMRSLLEKETGMQYIETVLRYILGTADGIGIDDLKTIVANNLSESQENTIISLAEKIKQEGRVEGRMEGRMEGEFELLAKIISAKFRMPPETVKDRLAGLNSATVSRLAERIFDLGSFDQVVDWIAKNKAS